MVLSVVINVLTNYTPLQDPILTCAMIHITSDCTYSIFVIVWKIDIIDHLNVC